MQNRGLVLGRKERFGAPTAVRMTGDRERAREDVVAVDEQRNRGLRTARSRARSEAKKQLAENGYVLMVRVDDGMMIERPARLLGPR
jgi:hypothetical protein